MLKQPITTVISIGLALVFSTFPIRSGAQTNRFSQPLKASDLMGQRVENTDGVELGSVRNLVIDRRTGHLAYVVLGSGGFFGVGTKLKVVPPYVLSAATAKRQTLAMNVTKERWQTAPGFRLSQLSSLAQHDRSEQIARFYGQPGSDVQLAVSSNAKELAATGAKTGGHPGVNTPDLVLVSDIIGQRILNRSGEKIGEVLDVLVSLDHSRPAFAIISAGRLFRNRDHQYAVALQAFDKTDDREKLILNTDRKALQTSRPFAPSAWSGTENEIYRYDESAQHAESDRSFFEQIQQPRNEKESYGKVQIIGKHAAA